MASFKRLRQQIKTVRKASEAAGIDAIRQLPNLSARDLEWIQREATKLLIAWKPPMENGISPGVYPAVWIYATAAVQKYHELGMKAALYISPFGIPEH